MRVYLDHGLSGTGRAHPGRREALLLAALATAFEARNTPAQLSGAGRG